MTNRQYFHRCPIMVFRNKQDVTKLCMAYQERIFFICMLTFIVFQVLIISFYSPTAIVVKANLTISRVYVVVNHSMNRESGDSSHHSSTNDEGYLGRSPFKHILRTSSNHTTSIEQSAMLTLSEKLHRQLEKKANYRTALSIDNTELNSWNDTDSSVDSNPNRRVSLSDSKQTEFDSSTKTVFMSERRVTSELVYGNHVCKSGNHPKIVILVTSAPSHFQERDAIRKTWGRSNNVNAFDCVFTLGLNDKGAVDDGVKRESEVYGDVIVGNFIDTYRNLTYKTLFGFKWATVHCVDAQFVMKTDDDVYINIPSLIKFLEVNGTLLNTGIAGLCLRTERPNRTEGSKWFVSTQEYAEDEYPDFCSGIGYLTNRNVIQLVLNVAKHIPIFHLEDVFIGICLNKLRLTVHDIEGFYQTRPPSIPCLYKGPDAILIHNVASDLMQKIWNVPCDNQFLHSKKYQALLVKLRLSYLLV